MKTTLTPKAKKVAASSSKLVVRKEKSAGTAPKDSSKDVEEVDVEDIFPATPVAEASMRPPKAPLVRSSMPPPPVILELEDSPIAPSRNCSSADATPRNYAVEVSTQLDGNDDAHEEDEEDDDDDEGMDETAYDKGFETELHSNPELRVLAEGTLPYDVRSMYIAHVQGQKSRRRESFLFENLRALVLLLAYDNISKGGTLKSDNLYNTFVGDVIGLLDNFPREEKAQRDIFHYMQPEYKEEFDEKKTYDWPKGFREYFHESTYPKAGSKAKKKGKEKDSASDIARLERIDYGSRLYTLAGSLKSGIGTRANGFWNRLKSGETRASRCLSVLKSMWEFETIERKKENVRKSKKKTVATIALKNCSEEEARRLNVMACKAEMEEGIANGDIKQPSWYPPVWLYFMRHGLACPDIKERKASAITCAADLYRTEGEPTVVTQSIANATTSRNQDMRKRKRADSRDTEAESDITLDTAKSQKAITVMVTKPYREKENPYQSETAGVDSIRNSLKELITELQDVLKEEDLSEESRRALKRRLIEAKVELCDLTTERTESLKTKTGRNAKEFV